MTDYYSIFDHISTDDLLKDISKVEKYIVQLQSESERIKSELHKQHETISKLIGIINYRKKWETHNVCNTQNT